MEEQEYARIAFSSRMFASSLSRAYGDLISKEAAGGHTEAVSHMTTAVRRSMSAFSSAAYAASGEVHKSLEKACGSRAFPTARIMQHRRTPGARVQQQRQRTLVFFGGGGLGTAALERFYPTKRVGKQRRRQP
jgi:hypothetical protein